MSSLQFSSSYKVYLNGVTVSPDFILEGVIDKDLGQPETAIITLKDVDETKKMAKIGANLEIPSANARIFTDGEPTAAIFKGEIVGIEPTFKAGGESRIVLRAFDKLHRLTRGRRR